MQTLDQEKFASLKELSEIQLKLAEGRAELKKLQDTTEEYEKTREKGAYEAVQRALEASKGALSEADKNRDTLAHFLTSAKETVQFIKTLHENLATEFSEFATRTDEAITVINQKADEVNRATEQIRLQRNALESERGGFEEAKRKMNEEKRVFDDRKATLERAINRLKQGKV